SYQELEDRSTVVADAPGHPGKSVVGPERDARNCSQQLSRQLAERKRRNATAAIVRRDVNAADFRPLRGSPSHVRLELQRIVEIEPVGLTSANVLLHALLERFQTAVWLGPERFAERINLHRQQPRQILLIGVAQSQLQVGAKLVRSHPEEVMDVP